MPRHPLILLPLLAFALTSCARPDSAKIYESQGKTVFTNIAYAHAEGNPILLDIYLPQQGTPSPSGYPVIVWIHGGGWRWGSKSFVPVLKLTDVGYAVVSIDYRLDGHAKYPAQIIDCRSAMAWLKENGSRYHLDVRRLGLIGASAGGHLAALLGTTENEFPNLPGIRAVCALYPPTDLLTVVQKDELGSPIGLVPLLLGGSVNDKKELAWSASPVRYVSSADPPFFLIHGQEDTLVPVEQSLELRDVLVKAGVPCQLEICPHEKHGFYPDADLTKEITAFFNRYLRS